MTVIDLRQRRLLRARRRLPKIFVREIGRYLRIIALFSNRNDRGAA